MVRVVRSRLACSSVPPRQSRAYALKPAALGCTTSSTPMKPVASASQRRGPTFSAKAITANSVMNSGVAMLIAVALASGRWNSDVR